MPGQTRSTCTDCGFRSGLSPGRGCPECGGTLVGLGDGSSTRSGRRGRKSGQQAWAAVTGVVLVLVFLALALGQLL